MTIFDAIESLCAYGLEHRLIEKADRLYIRNQVMELLNIRDYQAGTIQDVDHFQWLKVMVDYAYAQGIIESDKPPYSDMLEARIMNTLMPRPSEIIGNFQAYYGLGPKQATDYYYDLSKVSHYIRLDRTSKNMVWQVPSDFGDIDITVNLSKPEKDPKAIAAALQQEDTQYPKCLLCKENEGYSGHLNHPARQNHRIIPLRLTDEDWFFQYSPYAYFNEHSIVFKDAHDPMVITEKTFERLVDFVNQFPHYFIGSNADLPLVGGSMLSHDHYQCGDYVFPMEKTNVLETYEIEGVKVHHMNWPLTVLRLETKDQLDLLKVCGRIFNAWKGYNDLDHDIQAYTGDERHNTVTPILRKRSGLYQMDLVLRNNRTSQAHPTGIFHPFPEVHAVKKENIGLIEVMGLAVLPARLKHEMEAMAQVIHMNQPVPESLEVFGHLLSEMKPGHSLDQTHDNVKAVIGQTFVKGLTQCGVFKLDGAGKAGLQKFIAAVNRV